MKTTLLALLVLVAAAASACTDDRADRAAPAERVATETLLEESVPVDQALAATSAYFGAFNDGDPGAVTALIADGAEFSDAFSGSITRNAWEQRLAWNLAQGTTLASPNCFVPPTSDAGDGPDTEVVCESATLNAQIQAVGARPVPTDLHFSVSPDGIRQIREDYGQPDFLQAVNPFFEWVEKTHPDTIDAIGFNRWDSVASADQNGQLTREYSRRWAAWLESNCVQIPDLVDSDRDSYLDDC